MNINNKRIKYAIIFLLATTALFVLILDKGKKSPEEPAGYNIINNTNRENKDEPMKDDTKKPSTNIDDKDTSNIAVAENEDWEFGQAWKEIYKKYPWYGKFPIEKDGYILLWDLDRESFRIRLKMSENGSKEQKDSLLSEALNDIEVTTGISSKNFDYYVLYTN